MGRVSTSYGRIPKSMRKCLICECLNDLTVHHIIPKCEGGTDLLLNLMVLCRDHHDEIEGQGEYSGNRSKEVIEKYNAELIRRGLKKYVLNYESMMRIEMRRLGLREN